MIDLQQALRLYRRQGTVSAQDRHWGRTLVFEAFPQKLSTEYTPAFNWIAVAVPLPILDNLETGSSGRVHRVAYELLDTVIPLDGATMQRAKGAVFGVQHSLESVVTVVGSIGTTSSASIHGVQAELVKVILEATLESSATTNLIVEYL